MFYINRTKITSAIKTADHLLRSHLLGDGKSTTSPAPVDEQPLRGEMFSVSQLDQHARSLSTWHEVQGGGGRDRLLARLTDNEAVLGRAYELLSEAVKLGRRVTPAAEWFLDNFHLVEEQIRTARRHLPRGYSRELPLLTKGPSAGFPRVYGIALEMISHVDGRIDIDSLRSFVASYQAQTPLRLGELWAIPIMLRLALLENLRRVVAFVVSGREDRERAGYWIERMLDAAAKEPGSVVMVLAEMAKERPALTVAFVSEFASRMQGQSTAMVIPITWLEQRLGELGQTIEGIFRQASQNQAADQLSIGNSIGSLRLLGATDWKNFVEAMSRVEKALATDPAGVYPTMDFATRDRYRHAVEEIARQSPLTEEAVAASAIELSKNAVERGVRHGAHNDRHAAQMPHVGYFLIGHGRPVLEKTTGMSLSLRQWINRHAEKFPLGIYVGSILATTGLLTGLLLWWYGRHGMSPVGLVFFGLLLAVCVSHLALSLIQWGATSLIHPRLLPRLDYTGGIPAVSRTVVAVPCMLIDAAEIDDLLDGLEVRFLANRDENVSFVLLSDFRDAAQEHMPQDATLIQRAGEGIAALNAKYSAGGKADAGALDAGRSGNAAGADGSFLLYHRNRRWNAQEGVWMGWERKRGKLEQFNAALRGNTGGFDVIVGPVKRLADARYVITLDSDTDLPRDTAHQLAAVMSHPLNRPYYDAKIGRITEGYGILQPRVGISMPSAAKSLFSRLFSGEPGIDPYTRAVSDVYQDIFCEGSFVGKGIYDIDALQHAIAGRFPENRVLSHDLLEGAYARAGLVSDLTLFEDFPSAYPVDVSRRYRWIRGDWQIAPWLLSRVPTADGALVPNPLSGLSRLKIFDNLRRSLVPIALAALLLAGWFFSGAAVVSTLVVFGILLLPAILTRAAELARRRQDLSMVHHGRLVLGGLVRQVLQEAFTLGSLPYDALISGEAIVRTANRLLFTRQKLLEWRTARDAQRSARIGLGGYYASMWILPAVAVLALLALGWHQPASLLVAGPILLLWFLAPAIASRLSQPIRRKPPRLNKEDYAFLDMIARRTWKFFERFVGPEDHYLPPDNFQENPPRGIAHRTSPTNIGLSLLANLAAYDFKYIAVDVLIERTTRTIDTLDKLQRFRGHFYNWYDTQTLEPLRPHYISTVDSGNLAGHLITLAAGFDILADEWLARLRAAQTAASDSDSQQISELRQLAVRCREYSDIDYSFLYDKERQLLSIGYDVDKRHLDASFYDLLASEARLASFVAISQGRLPQDHWFRLGRVLTTAGRRPALLSWSGSMFEYLMPMLVMPTFDNTLLDETCRAAVKRQVQYGRQRNVPWGISESGYSKTDAHLNYQYLAFGVPGLGFKRGLADDLVIAPYATALALMVDPKGACANLRRLAHDQRLGEYGFYEAIDYTPTRLAPGQSSAVVRSFMAHHQGMSFLSLAYLLLDRPMQRRFTSDPSFRATELLLQERVPRTSWIFPHPAEVSAARNLAPDPGPTYRIFTTPNTPTPEVHLLSNGRYHVAVTAAGSGYSRWRDLSVTRWRDDTTRDCWGTFCYLRDVESGEFWSATHQPTLRQPLSYEAIYSHGRAEFRRRDGDIETHVEIAVSPEDDVEMRQISVANRGRVPRQIEFTSFAEVVLAPAASDAAHPAFSNLFVQTQILRERRAIICTRRPRSADEKPPSMIHLMTVHGEAAGKASYETARADFIGRGRTIADPAAMHRHTLGDSEGSVLDPIVAIRTSVTLAPDETIRMHMVTGVAETREGALALIEKYHDPHLASRVLELAWTHSLVVIRQLDAPETETRLYGRLASAILYPNALLRAPASVIARNRRGQSGLWGFGISGDLPIVLVRIGDVNQINLVRQLVQAHAYWRIKGLSVDLVIWNEDQSVYRQALQEQITAVVVSRNEGGTIDKPGGIFIRRVEQMTEEDKVLMQAVARIILSDTAGTLAQQIERRARLEPAMPRLGPLRLRRQEFPVAAEVTRRDLAAFNGIGGFTKDGHEYIITTTAESPTPAPWVNVLANPWFGTVVSESGTAYTWCENAHSYRLTPWNNDPVGDFGGEAFYVRDEDAGRFWSPCPLPARGSMPYTTRHGFGYSIFEYAEGGIATEMYTYVATDAPVKFVVIKIRNASGKPRRLSITSFFELVLGDQRSTNSPHVTTEIDPKTGALLGRNSYSGEFGDRVAFLESSEPQRTVTGDRGEFLGRNGAPDSPDCMTRARLSGRVGAALDPCAAMQVAFDLSEGQEKDIAFIFGSGRDLADTRDLIGRFRGTGAARAALEGVWGYWNYTLGAVNVDTPDPSLNFLANGWLVYQVLACRMWGRSGFYQSGGAYGFRDQLQDAMALVHSQPTILREQLLRSAARQFRAGDVQHWWHPPAGRGVRTHISDDYLWLPFAACRYIAALGDTGVLDEKIFFLDARPVRPDEESYYDLPTRSDESATLYEHCVRAIKHGLRFGAHGLPLMGGGDWNDGMNLVGEKGRGESVWLAFFLYDVLVQFLPLALQRNDTIFADLCRSAAGQLQDNIEKNAWDGSWYRRAYFDDGQPLGSSANPECQIDALPQSWSVLSKAGDPARSKQALDSLDSRLVRRDIGVIQLFDPPFDKSPMNPGYIKGYVPGVRENGGQYTHAAVWTVMAFAEAGDRVRAWELFNLINPVRHGDTRATIATYKVEPYVVAADVYTNPQHVGRGGWTWYTGSAGWMYRLITESLLGLRLEVNKLRFAPCLPKSWDGYIIHYRYHATVYHIRFRNGGNGKSVARVIADGAEQADRMLTLYDDHREHHVQVDIE
ncbi:MAG TPA: glucoamylase family protein [Tepidisphaeraceae bacterium]|jgi:cyclic beta-1,2-glucan synthetase|nr:glucoamylase family protein [Tepidisphaeraceae bacterium]